MKTILKIQNTEKRVTELVEYLGRVVEAKKQGRLKLRGRLGIADGFLHGRLGALILKRLVDHAYSSTNNIDSSLSQLLLLMIERLQHAGPKRVDARTVQEWCVYTDASYENTQESGGLGVVLIGPDGECAGWFSLRLSSDVCEALGSEEKETIIYELELIAACVALDVWSDILSASYPIHYGDNDSVRFALIRGTGLGLIAETIMNLHLRNEVFYNSNVWFARVPKEANIADIPSRFEAHPVLQQSLDISSKANESLLKFFKEVSVARQNLHSKGGSATASTSPSSKKRAAAS